MKEDEIDEYLFNYIYRGAKLHYLDKSNFNHPKLFENLAHSIKLDRPDLYFIDHQSKTIYIFEHFQINASDHSKKGSTIIAEMARNDKKAEKAVAEKERNGCFETSVYRSQLESKLSYKSYVESSIKSFNEHKSRIPQYKEHVCEQEHISENDYSFLTTFIIEDGYIGGTPHYKDVQKGIHPYDSMEFLNVYQKQSLVDCIICSSQYPEKNSFSLARQDIQIAMPYAVNLSKETYPDSQPRFINITTYIKRK